MAVKFTDKQKIALKKLSTDCRYTLLRGGGRSSKTFTFIYAVITRALKKKSRHLVARKTFQHCKQSLWFGTFEAVIEICYPELVGHIKDNKDLWFKELPNGSQIWFGGLDDKERVDKVLGNEYSTIFLNEVSEISWDAVGTVITRLAEKSGLKNKIYLDCNPTSTSHWTYQLFFKGKQPDTGKDIINRKDYQELQMNPIDNLANIDPLYIADLENSSERKKRRFLHGEYADDVDIAIFQDKDVQYYREIPSRIVAIIQSWDTAFKKGEHNDFSVCLTWVIAYDKNNKLGYYLKDIFSRKMDYPELKAAVIEMAARFSPEEILIEDAASGQSLIQDLINGTDLNIIPCSPQRQDKVTRAMYAADFMARKVVYLPLIHELVDEFRGQLLLFPFSENDDYVDSFSQFFKYIKTGYEQGRFENEEELGYIGCYDMGDRDSVTGY